MKGVVMCKIQWLGALLIAGGVYAASVVENFDWGAGVAGRETFSEEMKIDGVPVQSGGVILRDMAKDTSFLTGSAGPGNGFLRMKGANNSVHFDYPVAGRTVMRVSGKFFPGEKGVRGFWIGFQSSSSDSHLLNNQTTDGISVRIHPTGVVSFLAQVGGENWNAPRAGGNLLFSPGDTLHMELTVDVPNKTAAVRVTGQGVDNAVERILQWTSDRVPDWNQAVINQTGGSELLIDSVEVHSDEPVVG